MAFSGLQTRADTLEDLLLKAEDFLRGNEVRTRPLNLYVCVYVYVCVCVCVCVSV